MCGLGCARTVQRMCRIDPRTTRALRAGRPSPEAPRRSWATWKGVFRGGAGWAAGLTRCQALEVKVTGDFRRSSLQMTQKELEQVLASRGALPVGDIRRTTDLLIRAESASWKYGTFGDREAELAEHRARGGRGVVIDVDDLAVLLNSGVVWARDPLAPPEELLRWERLTAPRQSLRAYPSACSSAIPVP